MMGMRGVRLSIYMPEIVEMQVRAIFEAAADCTLRGIVVKPEVMIPLTGTVKELEWIQPRLERIAAAVMGEKKVKFEYKFGTMIEIPRAAVTAGEVAEHAQFFSFGTNDLTQMTYGYSRDDAERNFLITYQEQGILETNPFQIARPWWRGQTDGLGNCREVARPAPILKWVSAANMVVTRARLNGVTSLATTMSPAHRSVCRSPALQLHMLL